MKVLLFSCLLGGACAFGANPELASEGAVAQGFGTPGAPSEGDGRETRFGGGSPGSGVRVLQVGEQGLALLFYLGRPARL